MVGRSKRQHVATSKGAETSNEDDIVCLDIPVKQRRRNKLGTKQKMRVEKKFEENSNEFAGFDVEDATEEEKRQLREAILASTNDQNQQNCEDMNREGFSVRPSHKTEFSTENIIEINSEEDQSMEDNTSTHASKSEEPALHNVHDGDNDDDDVASAADDDVIDDDETQPPSDLDENEFVLNLDQPTIDESKTEMSNTESTNIEDNDETLREEDVQEDFEDTHESIDTDNIPYSTKKEKDIKYESSDRETEEEVVGMSDASIESQFRKKKHTPDASEGFDVDIDKDIEDDDNTVEMDYQSNIPEQLDHRQRARRSASHESWQQSGSKDVGNHFSMKSPLQGSLDSEKEAASSSGQKTRSRSLSRQSSSSSSQKSEIGTEHVPLHRHYRGVRPEFQSVKHEVYFDTSRNEELERSALAIYQLFEIYRTKLKMAQRKLIEKIKWSEPIKSGQHQTRTLDAKRRGKESIYIDFSDSDEDFQNTKAGRTCRNQKRNVKDMEDVTEIPELIIESENSNDSLSHRKSARKPPKSRAAENDIMSANTQPYDILDTNDEEDMDFETRTRVKGGAKVDANRKNVERKPFGTDVKENKEKPTRGRPRKKDVKKVVVPQVLVEETQQEDMDLEEALRLSKPDSPVSVEETQQQYEEFDWLSVGKVATEKEKLEKENGSHAEENIPRSSNTKPGQKYAKTHNKVFSQDKNMGDDNFENEPNNDDKNLKSKSTTRGKKRKAKRPPVVTLVEETQDIGDEGTVTNVPHVKRKRNCFMLDSGSEEESIAESQDVPVDRLSEPEIDLEERTETNRASDKTHSKNSNNESSYSEVLAPSSNINARDFVSPVKNDMSDEDNEEGSQSPVICKKKTFSSATKKMHTKSCVRNKDIHFEEEPFKSYKANSSEKKFKDASSSIFLAKERIQVPFRECNQEDNDISEGVKRFINRPSSKDSNASDNISTTSSQMSTQILDEKGDLYSTQFCEIKARKGKGSRSKSKSKSENLASDDEVLMLDESNDDIPVMKEPKKTYAVKRLNKKTPVAKDVWSSRKKEQKVSKNKNIRQFFSQVKKPDDNDVPIELDEDSNEEEDELVVEQRSRGINQSDIDEHSQEGLSQHSKSKSKYRNVSNKENEQNITKSSVKCSSNIESEMEVMNDKADVDSESYDTDAFFHFRNNLGRSKKQGKGPVTKTSRHLNMEIEDSEQILNDLSSVPSEKRLNFNENHGTIRLNYDNIESDRSVFDVDSRDKTRRYRRVSETISSADDDNDEGSTWSREQDKNDSEDNDHTSNDERNRMDGGRNRAGNHISADDSKAKKKIEKVECPLCSRLYAVSVIEEHAATCEGLVDEDEGTRNEEEHITEHNPVASDEEMDEVQSHQHYHKRNNHHWHDADHHHQNHTAALHSHQGGSASGGSSLIQNDGHMKDVTIDLSCSPGEEGELQSCYICDEQVLKGKPFEVHIKRCLAMAAQQQAVVDEKGFYAEPEEDDEVQVRTLRGRQVNNDRPTPSRGKAPRGRQAAEGSPGDRRRPKRESYVESRSAGDGEEDSGEMPRLDAQEAGGNKRVITKRMNRNKITQNDDGYNSDLVILESNEIDDSSSGGSSSWEESSSTDSSDDDNISLASVVKSGSSALITGPWNKDNQSNKKNANQSDNCNNVPDWVRMGVNSPIKSFVPISQQEDPEYFQKQFSYKKEKVENRMSKRKRASQSGRKRRRKRRKVKRTNKN